MRMMEDMTNKVTKRNPATRLREILTLAKGGHTGDAARNIWCQVFQIHNPQSERALLEVQERLMALRKLFKDAETSLSKLPNVNEDLFVKPISRLAQVINLNGLHNTWANYSKYLSDNDMFSLRYGEDLLSQNLEAQENDIPNNEIQEILTELNSLHEAIKSSALPKDLKSVLLDLIQGMIKGVHEYQVRGAVALKDALIKSIGILVANKDAIEENKDSEEIQALSRTLDKIDMAYSFAMRMKPLLKAAAKIFPALTPHVE
jgi:hypothetical protein